MWTRPSTSTATRRGSQIKGIFTHPKRLLVAALAAVLLVGVITVGGYLLKIRAPELPNKDNTQKGSQPAAGR